MNKSTFLFFAVFLFFMLVSGCEKAQLVSKNELMIKTKTWQEPKVAIWYYVGSDDEFDYFFNIDLNQSNLYKIHKNDIEIEKEFPLTKQESKWQVMPWGPLAHRR